MPLLRVEAERLSNNLLLSGVIEELITQDEMFAMIPFMGINTKSLDYIREDETAMNTAITGTASVDFLDPVTGTIPEAAMSVKEVNAKLRILAGQVDIDQFLNSTMGDTNNQLAIQLAAKAKVIRSKFQRNFAIGNATTNPKEFDGLPQLVTSGQTVIAGASGATLTLDMLDELIDKIPYGSDAIVMNAKTWRAAKTMMRALNIQPEYMPIPNIYVPVPSYNGIPILRNDYLPLNEVQGASGAVCTSIYAIRFNEADGLHGLYGGPQILQVENVGLVADKDSTRTRLKMYASVALRSTKSLARLIGVKLA